MNLFALLAQAEEPAVTLEPGGMVVMGLSILMVFFLMGFCFVRILRDQSPSEHHHAPLDIDTHDRDA